MDTIIKWILGPSFIHLANSAKLHSLFSASSLSTSTMSVNQPTLDEGTAQSPLFSKEKLAKYFKSNLCMLPTPYTQTETNR